MYIGLIESNHLGGSFMIVEEVAALLKEHPENIRRWIRQGKIKATKTGKRYDIPTAEVNRLKREYEHDEYVQVKAQAVGQLLVSNESEFEASLAMIHRLSEQLVVTLDKVVGVPADEISLDAYEKRRMYYESSEYTAFHSLINEVKSLLKLEAFSEMLKDTLKHEERANELLRNPPDFTKFESK